jgi:hypothetical protein
MTMLTGADREKQRDQITRPLNWPCFPVLPVKRNQADGQIEIGVIYWWHSQNIEDGGEVRVYLTNMFNFQTSPDRPAATQYEFKDYKTLDEFFDDGWRGD